MRKVNKMKKTRGRKRRKFVQVTALCIKGVPIETKNYFKAHCAKMGKTMSDILIGFMKKSVADARKADRPFKREDD